MVDPLISYLLCGWVQFQSGHKAKGALLFLSFPSSVAVAVHYLSAVSSQRDLEIGMVALALAVLIWSYHFLDLKEHATQPTNETLPSPRRVQRQASKGAPNSLDALYTQGRIAFLRGSTEEAKQCFERLLQSDRQDSDAAFQLGRLYHERGDARNAERFFRQCQQSPGGGKWSEEIKKYIEGNKS